MARFGIQIGDFRFPAGSSSAELFGHVAAAARAAEDAGFTSLWVMDHFHQFPPVGERDTAMPEAFVLLGALASVTRTIGLGTLVAGVPYRNPAHLAKLFTTLDVVSGGRAIAGVGAGWQEDEYRAYGFGTADELPPVRERLDGLEDALRILRAMFAAAESSVEGHRAVTRGALNVPRPVRAGGPPILVGGGGEKRLLRLLARYGDACNLFGGAEVVRHKLAVLDAHCAEVGRDPADITRTWLGGFILADTDAEADAIATRVAAAWGAPSLEAFDGSAVWGSPETLRRRVTRLLDAGLDELYFAVGDHAWTPETVAAAGAALAPLMG
ncbi:MAG: TIGR03560 family F420-dependent LLM class oxidoreductase [Thermoleophilia bacterium]|nr:TIGR03560 family F420-dependent LLM class oxidoreductase [Thermoleophilia bacterium]